MIYFFRISELGELVHEFESLLRAVWIARLISIQSVLGGQFLLCYSEAEPTVAMGVCVQ